MNALTVQSGDIAVRTDISRSFIYDGTQWVELSASSEVVSVNGQIGVIVLDYEDVGALAANDSRIAQWTSGI